MDISVHGYGEMGKCGAAHRTLKESKTNIRIVYEANIQGMDRSMTGGGEKGVSTAVETTTGLIHINP